MTPKTGPKLSLKQARKLLDGMRAAELSMRQGQERLAHLFPGLKARLDTAMEATSASIKNADLACRHVLCAEALVEVLETRTRDGRRNQGDDQHQIVVEYSDLAARKLLRFHRRSPRQQERIRAAHPNVNLDHVLLGYKHHVIHAGDIAGVLEDSLNYQVMLRTLNEKGLLPTAG